MCRENKTRLIIEQKQKYSNAIEKQSVKPAAVTMSGPGHLSIRKDISVKHLVSTTMIQLSAFCSRCT